MEFIKQYFEDAKQIIDQIDPKIVEEIVLAILKIRDNGGRLFFLGVGGSAANCSHAVNDFRKIGGFEAYTPVDNVAELTARTNDEGWDTVFAEWLKTSKLNGRDGVFVFSVGGGSKERNISANLVEALGYAKEQNAKILGIVGRDGGYTAEVADHYVNIPPVNPETVTPHTESFQAVIWHLIVAHPKIMRMSNKWESTVTAGKL